MSSGDSVSPSACQPSRAASAVPVGAGCHVGHLRLQAGERGAHGALPRTHDHGQPVEAKAQQLLGQPADERRVADGKGALVSHLVVGPELASAAPGEQDCL